MPVTIHFRGRTLELGKVLLDTGSASTLIKADIVGEIGIVPEEDDIVDTIRGVGGIEYVYTKTLDGIELDGQLVPGFQVEIGSMEYGLEMDGILGYDFMKSAGLVIDAKRQTVKAE
ncbi:aspartyl protease family protein [Cohnella lubricantis]|uniref:aspartyl protease family protein n=1 Tax=Cohnella lubricantis TaxID=2163172 RepID=UPI002893040A|nr:aspartyl protease family protein [Cohnella lubricantis]